MNNPKREYPYIVQNKPFGCMQEGASNKPDYILYYEGDGICFDQEQLMHLYEAINNIIAHEKKVLE